MDEFDRIEEKVSESINVTVNKRLKEFEERIMRVVHDALGPANQANSASRLVKANRMFVHDALGSANQANAASRLVKANRMSNNCLVTKREA
jgi:RNase P/RNase MRP subunit POP5